MTKDNDDRKRIPEGVGAEDRLRILTDALVSLDAKLRARELNSLAGARELEEAGQKDHPQAAARRGKAKAIHDARSSLHAVMYRHRLTDAEWEARQ